MHYWIDAALFIFPYGGAGILIILNHCQMVESGVGDAQR
jgi:hypothetical protein